MSTIRRIGLADLERLLEQWRPRRKITQFHLHCTDRPRRADFRGQATIEAMRAFHMGKGWSDIAQHLTVDPAGGIWTGRSWDSPPASARGHNGNAQAGPFMIEVIGNFDTGKDPFDGPQRLAVLGVIAAVLRKAGLNETALFFHRDFTNAKSCPGTGLTRATVRADVKALLTNASALELPSTSDAVLDDGEVRGWFGTDGARGIGGGDVEDPDFAEVPEDEWMLGEQEALAARLDAGPGAEGARRAPLPPDAPLRRHTVNLSKGVLSAAGDIDSVTVDPRTIVEKHLVDYIETCKLQKRTPHLLFYAHGGLVNEASAICYANTVLPWWLRNGVFPIFFIWESGLFETLRQTPRGARGVISDITDRLLEGLTQRVARRVWGEMKDDAANASLPALPQYQGRSGGAWQLAEYLRPVLASHTGVKLHAVGHSTGPIFLSKFLPLLIAQGRKIDTLSYLAPAIRTDRWVSDVWPLLTNGAIREMCMYTMTDEAERDDTCAKIYRKSLLYFVREACDDLNDGRILGLQKDLYANPGLRPLFGLPQKNDGRVSASAPPISVEFSSAPGSPLMNPKTRALQHGGFDNDAETMISVLARVLNVKRVVTNPAMQFPSPAAFKACGLADGTRAAEIEPAEEGDEVCCCPCCMKMSGGGSGSGFTDDGRDGFGDDDESGGGDGPDDDASGMPTPSGGGGGGGRRIAVCIGIDEYPTQPLDGCVNDSKRWAEMLERNRFEIRVLRNQQATRDAMHGALKRLVDEARPGDELVFQYSGHGAQIDDLDGDEVDPYDEVFVPIDFDEGQMLIDDDVRAITRGLVAGATLSLFMDCCHSGTNSRARRPRAAAGSSRPRLMTFDKETEDRYFEVRGGRPAKRAKGRVKKAASRSPGPGVAHFAACRDSEYAWETGDEGDFTRAAMAVFEEALRQGWSNDQFIAAVIRELRKPVRQHPRLWNPEAGLQNRKLLGGR